MNPIPSAEFNEEPLFDAKHLEDAPNDPIIAALRPDIGAEMQKGIRLDQVAARTIVSPDNGVGSFTERAV